MRPEKKRADDMKVGEEFEALEFTVTEELNEQYLFAMGDYHRAYLESKKDGAIVNPALLLNMSNIPKSPSFHLPSGMAGIIAKDETEFVNPGRVGKRFLVTWKVEDRFHKRERLYWWITAHVTDEDGREIIRRRMLDTYAGTGD